MTAPPPTRRQFLAGLGLLAIACAAPRVTVVSPAAATPRTGATPFPPRRAWDADVIAHMGPWAG